MCGIIAVLRRRSRRAPPSGDELRRTARQALQRLPATPRPDAGVLQAAASQIEQIDRLLPMIGFADDLEEILD